MTHVDAVELRRVEVEEFLHGLFAQDSIHHLLVVQHVGNERLVFRHRDPEGLQKTLHLGRAMQSIDAA